jgi:hypothetical protein
MSRLLCVVAAMLLVTAALAAPGDVATATGTPQLKTSATPLAATAEFKATVATYASIVVTPPTTLAVPGDSALGVAGSAVIEPDLNDDWDAAAAEHGGLVEVSANDKCYLQMQVTEFAGTGEEGVSAPTTEKLKSLVKVGDIMVGLTPSGDPGTGWSPSAFDAGAPALDFVQIIDGVGGWDPTANSGAGDDITTMPWAAGGTYVVQNLPIDPLNSLNNPLFSDYRYVRLFWGTKAFNRIDADADASHEYETLAAKGDYVATVTATLTADAL